MRIFALCILIITSSGIVGYSFPSALNYNKIERSSSESQVELFRSLADSLESSEPVEFEEQIDYGILFIQDRNEPFLLIDLRNLKGKIYALKDDQENGIPFVEETLKLSDRFDYKKGKAAAYNLLGNFSLTINDYERALENFIAASELFRSVHDTINFSRTNVNIGLIYRWHGSPPEAIGYYREALKFAEPRNLSRHIAIINGNMGCAYVGCAKYDTAIIYLEKSLLMCESLHLESGIANVLISLVNAHLALKDYTMADKRIVSGLRLAGRLNLQSAHCELLSLKGRSEFEQGKYRQSIKTATENFELSTDRGQKAQALKALKVLVEANLVLGNTRKALEYFNIYYSRRLDFEQQNTSEQLASMQVKYDTERRIEKKQNEIDQLAHKNEVQLLRLKRERLLWYMLLALSVMFLLVSFLVLNRWKLKNIALKAEHEKSVLKQQKLELEIRSKNRELSTSTTFITEKNKILSGLQTQLQMLKGLNGNAYLRLDELSREIGRNINLDKDWKIMKMHFENVYPDFFSILKSRFPLLTPLDLKHCAYLKMKLSNKELAKILNIEPNSVKTLRYRLKKKLNLAPGDDLFGFVEEMESDRNVQ